MTNEIISVIANLALTLSFIVALVFGIAQVRAAERDRKERLALATIREFQTREFAELMQYITSHDAPPNSESWNAVPVNERIMIMQYLQQMESLGILVAKKLVDLDTVDITLGSFVTTTWDKYRAMIRELRTTLPDPFLAEYFQWLAEQVDERMKTNPRKPFYKDPKV